MIVLPIVLLMRLIASWKLIRIGCFFAGRIGHYAFDVEYYLLERYLGLHPKNAVDFFYYRGLNNGKPANDYYAEYTKRNLKVFDFIKYVQLVNSFIPGGEKHRVQLSVERSRSRDLKHLFKKYGTRHIFNQEENKIGLSYLNSIGVGKDEKWVCMIIRDSAYLPDYHYHNYRDSDIDTYNEAAKALAEKGYWVIRMGKVVEKPFNVNHHRVIDYSTSPCRSDFLDIWLIAHCNFMITTNTGLDTIAEIFNKPILAVNHLPVGDLRIGLNDYSMEYFKILKWKDTGKLLSLRDQINCGAISFCYSDKYEQLGIEIINNTPSQLKDAFLDFEKNLVDSANRTKNNILIDKFWGIMEEWKDLSTIDRLFLVDQNGNIDGSCRINISSVFLEEHHEWFLE